MKNTSKKSILSSSLLLSLFAIFISSCKVTNNVDDSNSLSNQESLSNIEDISNEKTSNSSGGLSDETSSIESIKESTSEGSIETSPSESSEESISESEEESSIEESSNESVIESDTSSEESSSHTHEYEEFYDMVKEPTLTETGLASRDCVAKDDTETVVLPSLSDTSVWEKHVDKEATCTTEGEDRYISSKYGLIVYYKSPIKDHVISDYKVSSITLGGKATVVKECEVGHEIIESRELEAPKQFALTIDNNYDAYKDIIVVDNTSSYPFIYDETKGTWTTSNKGVDSSSSSMSFKGNVTGTLEFDVVVSSESYDKFSYSGNSIGGSVSQHCSVSITSTGTTYSVYYSKDSSTSSGADTAIISNLIFKADSLPDGYVPDGAIVSFNTLGGSEVADVVVIKNSIVDNVDAIPTKDGYVFDGWYLDENLLNKLDVNKGLSSNTTLYASWAKLHNVILVKNNGEDNETLEVKNGESASLTKPTYEGKRFLGWFTTSTFESDSKYDGEAILENTTLYASWGELPSFVSEYLGVDVFGSTSVNTNKKLSIAEDGSLSNTKAGGVIDLENYDDSNYIHYTYNDDAGLMYYTHDSYNEYLIFSYSTSETINVSDVFVFVKKASSVTKTSAASSYLVWDGSSRRIFALNIDGNEIAFFLDGVKNRFYTNVSFVNDANETIAYSDIYKSSKYIDSFEVYDENGNYITGFKNVNNSLVEFDDFRNTYTGNEYGTISLDGYDSLKTADTTYNYYVYDNKAYVVIDNKLVVLSLDNTNKTYVVSKDIYEGTYEGSFGNLVLNGDGTGTLNDVAIIYYVKDSNVTLNGTDTYGLDVENKKYFAKSPFAGHTFVGTYDSDWNGGATTIKVIFNDTAELSGIIYSGYGTTFYFNFTATFDSETSTLIFTFGKCIDSSATGKTLTATVSGTTMTFVSGYSANCYEFTTNGSASDATFSL